MINGYQAKIMAVYEKIRDEESKNLELRRNEIRNLYPEIMDIDNLIQKKISLDIYNLQNYVYIDEKWITFIICQIVQNSIKYLDKPNKIIKIHSEENKNNVVLIIEDNGEGILDYDLPRVFEYGFTGSDRQKQYSTGMGLYLCKKLCNKMNLDINIESEYKRFTKVKIIFPKTSLYKL